MKRYVAYLRGSTDDQQLTIVSQRVAVMATVRNANGELLGEFEEHESGTDCTRPELAKALSLCAKERATLIVAKLDRLARNVGFLTRLLDAEVPLLFVDMPSITPDPMGRFLVIQMANFAELEVGMIRQRTKAGLQVIKDRLNRGERHVSKSGRVIERLGNPDPSHAAALGRAASMSKADAHAAIVLPLIAEIRRAGLKSLAEIAGALNARGIATARGGAWHSTTVRNVLRRSAMAP